jgi:hypothetical protein
MYTLLKETYGDFDIAQNEVVAVSENLATLQAEADRLNAQRKKEHFKYGEWDHTYRAHPKKVRVM